MSIFFNRAKGFFNQDYLNEQRKRVAGILVMVCSAIFISILLILSLHIVFGSVQFLICLSAAYIFVILAAFLIYKNLKDKAFKLIISEKHLKESESILRIFINAIDSSAVLIDSNYRLVVVNKAFALRRNKTVGELEGSDATLLFSPEVTANRMKNIGQVFETGKPVIFEDSNNGKYFIIYAYPVYDELTGIVSRAAVLAFDVTDNLNPLGENILLAQTLKSVKDAVSISDNNDDIIFVNDAFLSTYGYTEKEIIGKKISIIRPFDTSAVMADIIHNETLKGGWHGEVLNHRKNGEHFTVELWTSIVTDKEGNKIGTVGIARDISDRKKAEKELIEAKDKAEELSRLKSNFLSNMSHELRTPLVGILGFAEILADEIKDEKHKEMIVNITEGAGRLSTTLNQILDLAKIETNKSSIEWAKIDLSYVISSVINLYSAAAKNKNIRLKSSYSEPELAIWGDERMLFSIVNNLVNNAVKYSTHGEISVDAFIAGEEPEKYSVIKVTDTGIGIPEDKLDIIFEEFRQVSEGLSRGYEGTGLGLTICKKFVNLLNGSITVESKPGKGSTFTVKFPFYSEN